MLSEIERKKIEAELTHYPTRQAVSVEALKVVQRHRGWVSDEALRDVAAILEMSPDELDNVATFYNLIFRKPVGKHVILLCNSVSCWVMGYGDIRNELTRRLGIQFGETTRDKRFTLLPMVCLGNCERAPVMMIDEDTHRDLTPESIENILQQYH
jgi:NADH-quinone oxidoreductase subunit E